MKTKRVYKSTIGAYKEVLRRLRHNREYLELMFIYTAERVEAVRKYERLMVTSINACIARERQLAQDEQVLRTLRRTA